MTASLFCATMQLCQGRGDDFLRNAQHCSGFSWLHLVQFLVVDFLNERSLCVKQVSGEPCAVRKHSP